MPNTKVPSISSEVAIGRRINGADMLIGGGSRSEALRRAPKSAGRLRRGGRDLDPGAIHQSVLAIDDDGLTGCQPAC